MTSPLREPPSPPRSLPVGPSVEEWRAMSAEQRLEFVVGVNSTLTEMARAMSEGQPHRRAKSRAVDMLGLHFKKTGRVVYVAEELSVVYPGAAPFAPDVLAVVGMPQPADDERLAWVVADEGKGLDFVLEVLHRGDRRKDLVENVERYAALGIPEYFIYDRAKQSLIAYRLSTSKSRRYERILPQGGHHSSAVLGLDFAIVDGSLRIFSGMGELIGSDDLIGRLTTMVDSLESKAEDAEAKADRALAGLRAGVLGALESRGLPCSDALREQVNACDDTELLQRWLLRALTAASAEEALSG
ncbi:MAG: Uma2 family endonuclease [Polyangiaceae bacterium]